MILHFPDLETLRLALTAGAVPAEVSLAPAEAARGDDGDVFIRTDQPVPRSARSELKRLGVQRRRSVRRRFEPVSCWLQVLPLEPAGTLEALTDKTPVLFELDENLLAELVAEMLRLGNDRQAYRAFVVADLSADDISSQAGRRRASAEATNRPRRTRAADRVLLRVVGPPYYSLLRAAESDGGPAALRAYTEAAPRVWVEAGWSHPLAERIHPPPGRLLLMAGPNRWMQIDEAPFHDIYEIAEFDLPEASAALADAQLEHRLKVPLRLARSGSTEPAELWVLAGDAAEALDELVQSADDRLLARLSFAVATAGPDNRPDHPSGGARIVLRLRPGKEPPPVLVLDSLPCRPYLKIPNLFLPVGTRLHPPLRRDVVKELLGGDGSRITWLEPECERAGVGQRRGCFEHPGRFTPRSLPDAAFRPLADWIDYVLDREHEALEHWVQAHRFDFEPFVCPDEKPDRRKKPDAAGKPVRAAKTGSAPAGTEQPTDQPAQKPGLVGKLVKKFRREKTTAAAATAEAPRRTSDLQQRLRKLEQAFVGLDAPLDAPERTALWQELARANAALRQFGEAAICWTHVLWDTCRPQAEQIREWLACQLDSASVSTGKRVDPDAFDGPRLEKLLALNDPPPSLVEALAVWVVCAAHAGEEIAEGVSARLGPLQHFVEEFETYLPVRTCWLTWCALVELAGGDVLALARARDRLLERLYQHGLSPDRDLPAFLRASGLRGGERFRAVRDQIVALREAMQTWSEANRGISPGWTAQYIDLILAFGLARLGEKTRCGQLLEGARREMGRRHIHDWFLRAFEYRIGQVLEGKPASGPLPRELLEEAEAMDRLDRYKVDRLRQHSQILEPHEKIDPYRRWHRRYRDELSRRLAELFDVIDRNELAGRVAEFLHEQHTADERLRVLHTVLELSPRLGAVTAGRVLERVPALLKKISDLQNQFLLLEKGLFVAAHFDQAQYVRGFVDRLHRLIAAQPRADDETVRRLEPLLAESFRGMRKLGLRDNIARLLDQMAGLAEGSSAGKRRGKSERGPAAPSERGGSAPVRLLLQIAGGWFYFGREDRAWPILDRARELLFAGGLVPAERTRLACAYAAALGQAPAEKAVPRFRELFEKLEGIHDSYTTNTHYSLSQLDVVEAVVLATAGEEFGLDKTASRWLDEDEYLIRRRVHRDVRKAIEGAKGGPGL